MELAIVKPGNFTIDAEKKERFLCVELSRISILDAICAITPSVCYVKTLRSTANAQNFQSDSLASVGPVIAPAPTAKNVDRLRA